MTATDDFYEDDEPLEDVRAAYERGRQGITGPPHGLLVSALSDVTFENCRFGKAQQ